jgi:1-phosphatidylinositol-3-phosphate 5-kinase
MPIEDSILRASRLPRPVARNLSVAELVKKYQDFLPAQGVQALTQTAFAPRSFMSESEQEYPSQLTLRPGIRSKSRHRAPVKKVSTSDFEQGYVANVAPRYLRRTVTETNKTRISAPIGSSFESHESSRRPSPEKRFGSAKDVRNSRPSSPPANKSSQLGGKKGKNRVASRSKDKPAPRLPITTGNKSTFRRSSTGTSTKVPNIAKHFERLSRDAERSKSRYSIIRSKRARPVASARAKVQVLDSLKDAIGDDSEISDASSEADDEDEGNEEEPPLEPVVEKQPPEPEHISSESSSKTVSSTDTFPIINLNPPSSHDIGEIAPVSSPGPIHLPPSPFLSAVKTKNDATLTPPTSDQEMGGNGAEKNSILKALSGFWPQPARHSIEGDDSKGDPEHIFRDSSMVVRIDEPTSIIALALECVFYC